MRGDTVPPGVYWSVLCVPAESTSRKQWWLELMDEEPRRNGKPETTHFAWIGTRDGVVRLVYCLVAVDKRRRLRRAFPAQWKTSRNGPES